MLSPSREELFEMVDLNIRNIIDCGKASNIAKILDSATIAVAIINEKTKIDLVGYNFIGRLKKALEDERKENEKRRLAFIETGWRQKTFSCTGGSFFFVGWLNRLIRTKFDHFRYFTTSRIVDVGFVLNSKLTKTIEYELRMGYGVEDIESLQKWINYIEEDPYLSRSGMWKSRSFAIKQMLAGSEVE